MIATVARIIEDYNTYKPYFEQYGSMPSIGSQPSNITLKISKMTTNGGHAGFEWEYEHDTNKLTIGNYSITINCNIDFTEIQYYDTILHEMIHIFEYVNHQEAIYMRYVERKDYDFHGEYFEKMIAKISSDTGYKITKYMDYQELRDMRMTIKAYICIITDKLGKNLYMVVTPQSLKRFRDLSSRYYPLCEVYSTKEGTITYPFAFGVRATPESFRMGRGVYCFPKNITREEWQELWLNDYTKIDELDWE